MLGEENKDMKIRLLDELIEKLMDMDEGEQPTEAGLAVDGEKPPMEAPIDEEAKLAAIKGL